MEYNSNRVGHNLSKDKSFAFSWLDLQKSCKESKCKNQNVKLQVKIKDQKILIFTVVLIFDMAKEVGMRILAGILIAAGLVLVGCKTEEQPKQAKEESAKFVPPQDGKITKEMAGKYITASKYLLEAIKGHEKEIDKFTSNYKLNSDLRELSDSLYQKKHPEVIKAWDKLSLGWKRDEEAAYKKANISEDEFNWIGGALTDTLNKDIQKEIARRLEVLNKNQ